MAEMAGMAGMDEMAGAAGPIGIIERFKTGGVNSISSQWVGQTKMYLGLSHFWGVKEQNSTRHRKSLRKIGRHSPCFEELDLSYEGTYVAGLVRVIPG